MEYWLWQWVWRWFLGWLNEKLVRAIERAYLWGGGARLGRATLLLDELGRMEAELRHLLLNQ